MTKYCKVWAFALVISFKVQNSMLSPYKIVFKVTYDTKSNMTSKGIHSFQENPSTVLWLSNSIVVVVNVNSEVSRFRNVNMVHDIKFCRFIVSLLLIWLLRNRFLKSVQQYTGHINAFLCSNACNGGLLHVNNGVTIILLYKCIFNGRLFQFHNGVTIIFYILRYRMDCKTVLVQWW